MTKFAPNSQWTAALANRIKDLWANNSAGEIVNILADEGVHFTRNAIVGKLHRMKLTISQKRMVHPQTRSAGICRPHPTRQGNGAMVQKINRPKQIKAEPFVCQDASDIVPLNLLLSDLTDDTCHWPYGEDNFTFCGHIPKPGFPYCWSHCKIAYIAPPKRTKAPYIENRGRSGIFGRVA